MHVSALKTMATFALMVALGTIPASAALDREVGVLRNEKTDRAALADLFEEFSLRLKNDLELPEK